MKFNINSPLKEYDIERKRNLHLFKLILFCLIAISLITYIYFYTELVLFLASLFLFFSSLVVYFGDTFWKESLDFGSKYFKLEKRMCKKAFKLSEKHVEIRNYILSVNREGRQLYYYDYKIFLEFIEDKNKLLKEEEERTYCNKLYNEFNQE